MDVVIDMDMVIEEKHKGRWPQLKYRTQAEPCEMTKYSCNTEYLANIDLDLCVCQYLESLLQKS